MCNLILVVTILLLLPPTAYAEWSGSLRSGYSNTNNLGSQRTVDQGIGTSSTITRIGWANQANIGWQTIKPNGGWAVDTFGFYDKSRESGADISEVNLSASFFRAINPSWLVRVAGDYNVYRYDAVPISGYDGYGANLTFGYFGNNRQGLDLSVGWKFEDHARDPEFQYTTNRFGLNMMYYLPHAKTAPVWSLQGSLRRNEASDNFRDYNSYLLGLGLGNWYLGKLEGFAGLQWRANFYDDPVVVATQTTTDTNTHSAQIHNGSPNHMPGGGNMGGDSGATTSTQDVNDQLLSIGLSVSMPFSLNWKARLSATVGRYRASTRPDSQTYYDFFAGLQWSFN